MKDNKKNNSINAFTIKWGLRKISIPYWLQGQPYIKDSEKADLLKALFATVFDRKTADLEDRCEKLNRASTIQEGTAMPLRHLQIHRGGWDPLKGAEGVAADRCCKIHSETVFDCQVEFLNLLL